MPVAYACYIVFCFMLLSSAWGKCDCLYIGWMLDGQPGSLALPDYSLTCGLATYLLRVKVCKVSVAVVHTMLLLTVAKLTNNVTRTA